MSKAMVIKDVDFSDNAVDQITFEGIHTTSISVNPSTISAVVLGSTYTLTPTVLPTNSEDVIRWQSSDTNVAHVINGVVTINGCGTCDIIVKSGGCTARCTVTVQVTLEGSRYVKTRVAASGSIAANVWTATSSTIGSTYASLDMNMAMLDVDPSMETLNCDRQIAELNSATGEYEINPNADIIGRVGYVVPIRLPDNCKKIRCIQPDANYAAYPLFFKADVRANESKTENGYYSALRYAPWPSYSSFSPTYEAQSEFNVPAGYDAMAITWITNTETSATLPKDMTEEQRNQFKVICL